MTTQYKALLLLLVSGAAFADPNLTVTLVNVGGVSTSECTQGSTTIPTSSAFNVVITDVDANDPTVTIGSVTFNGHNGAEGTTGSPNIIGNSNSPTEQKYLLHSCNGKQLSYHQSCTIPMVFNYGTTPITTSTTLTVGAETDVVSGNYSTASFTIGNGIQKQGLTIAFDNVSNPFYQVFKGDFGLGSYMPSGTSEVLAFKYESGSDNMPAVFNYTITNHSNVTKTVGTRCIYSSQYFYEHAISNSASCDGTQLLPGQSCTATLTLEPYDIDADCNPLGDGTICISEIQNLLSVFDIAAAINVPENTNQETISFMGGHSPY